MRLEPEILTESTKRTINSTGGAIWSVSANPKSTILALGCEDGSIQLLSAEHDGLSHLRKLGKVGSRLLSIAWGPPISRGSRPSVGITPDSDDSSDDENDDEWLDGWLVTGCADSSIRKWDFSTGRITNRLTTDKTRGERTLVWAVSVLGCVSRTLKMPGMVLNIYSDGTIVSGDSMGIVKFWEPRTCTQLSTFQAHGADVLCLSIGPVSPFVLRSSLAFNTYLRGYRKETLFTLPASTRRLYNSPTSVGQRPHQNHAGFRRPPAVCTHTMSARLRFGLPSRPSPLHIDITSP